MGYYYYVMQGFPTCGPLLWMSILISISICRRRFLFGVGYKFSIYTLKSD